MAMTKRMQEPDDGFDGCGGTDLHGLRQLKSSPAMEPPRTPNDAWQCAFNMNSNKIIICHGSDLRTGCAIGISMLGMHNWIG